jgi:hypothetical protein
MVQQSAVNRADLDHLAYPQPSPDDAAGKAISGGKSVAWLQHSLTKYGILPQKLKKSAVALVLTLAFRHKRKK